MRNKILYIVVITVSIFCITNSLQARGVGNQAVIKITSKNTDKTVTVGMAYQTAGENSFFKKQTPFEEKIDTEFINGSFLKLAGEGEIKVEITETLTNDFKNKKSYIWGEGEFVNIKSETVDGKKSLKVSTSDSNNIKTEKFRRLFEKLGINQSGQSDLSLNNATEIISIEKHRLSTGFTELARNPSLKTYWENYFARTLNNAVVGYSYAVYSNGKPIVVNSYGYDKLPQSSDDAGVSLTPQTLIQIASVSKPITAVALLHLLEEKQISPDTKFWTILKSQFPNIKPGKGVEEITIAQLLAHRSGYKFGYVETPRLKNLAELLTQSVPEEIGEKYRYSNINYSIARTLIEKISKKDYQQYVREEIFYPVGAEDVSLNVNKNTASNIYLFGDPKGEPLAIDFRDNAGAYGWYATAKSIAKFAEGVRTNKYLSPKMTKLMFDKNLGWGKANTSAGVVYRHEGQWVINGNKGIHSGIAIFPDGTQAVLLINTNSGFSASGLLVKAFSENYPIMRGIRYPGDKTKGFVRVEIPANVEEVRCTKDGSEPNSSSPIYVKPIVESLPLIVKCQGFINKNPVTFTNKAEVKQRASNN